MNDKSITWFELAHNHIIIAITGYGVIKNIMKHMPPNYIFRKHIKLFEHDICMHKFKVTNTTLMKAIVTVVSTQSQ